MGFFSWLFGKRASVQAAPEAPLINPEYRAAPVAAPSFNSNRLSDYLFRFEDGKPVFGHVPQSDVVIDDPLFGRVEIRGVRSWRGEGFNMSDVRETIREGLHRCVRENFKDAPSWEWKWTLRAYWQPHAVEVFEREVMLGQFNKRENCAALHDRLRLVEVQMLRSLRKSSGASHALFALANPFLCRELREAIAEVERLRDEQLGEVEFPAYPHDFIMEETLRRRGWNAVSIERFLQSPDAMGVDPEKPKARKVRELWSFARVAAAEASLEFRRGTPEKLAFAMLDRASKRGEDRTVFETGRAPPILEDEIPY